MNLRFTLSVAAAAMLAAAAWSNVAANLAGREPVIAVPLLTGPGTFSMSPTEREALYKRELAASRLSVLGKLARERLKAEPLSPTAIWLLAAERNDARTSSMLLLAEQVTRRELGVQMALFRSVAERGNLTKSLTYLDRGLTIHPEAAPGLLSNVVPALAEPKVRGLFLPYAQRPWFNVLLRESATKAADSLDTSALITEAKLGKDQLATDLLQIVLNRLIQEGEVYEAGRLAMATSAITEAGLENFAVSTETIVQNAQPLTWQFASNEVVSSKVQSGSKIEWTIEAGRSAILAERVTLYQSGSYQLTQALSGSDQRILTVWELRCIDDAGERRVWSQAIPLQSNSQRSVIDVLIPDLCPAQRWTLKGSANDLQVSGDVILQDLDLKNSD